MYNFFDDDFLETLPEDPEAAFVQLVIHARQSLNEQMPEYDERYQNEWDVSKEIRYAYTSNLIEAAKEFDIEQFASYQLPKLLEFTHSAAQSFDHEVSTYVARQKVRQRKTKIILKETTKDRLRKSIIGLQSAIDKSDIEEWRKSRLKTHLENLELELDRARTSWWAISRLLVELALIPPALIDGVGFYQKVYTDLKQAVYEAGEITDHLRLQPSPSFALIEPPKKSLEDHREVT